MNIQVTKKEYQTLLDALYDSIQHCESFIDAHGQSFGSNLVRHTDGRLYHKSNLSLIKSTESAILHYRKLHAKILRQNGVKK